MKMAETLVARFERSLPSQIAVLLIVSVLFWAFGVPTMVKPAQAAYMSQISDTLSNSNPGSLSKHTVQYTTATTTDPGMTIKIQVDPATNSFIQYFSSATSSDIYLVDDGVSIPVLASCSGSSATAVGNYNNGSDENLTLTLCPGTTIASGSIVNVVIGSTTMLWQNPNPGAGAGMGTSYRVLVAGTQIASGETRVAIIGNITLTATVNSVFDFRIAPVTIGNTVGNTVTGNANDPGASVSSTTLAFGSLASGTPATLAQRLNVTTNAQNGFSVTVQENQPPTANSGSIIYLFRDGASTTLAAWTAPLGTLNAYQTYGHFGITSTDSDLNSNEFNNATFYTGNIIQPRVVFSHNGPANGLTNDQGSTTVAFKLQSTDLLPAGAYTNTITYVATPTF